MTRMVCLGIFALTMLIPSLANAQNSPLAKAAVGDWVEFKGEAPSLLGKPVPMTIRYTVKAKNETEVTLTMKSWAGDRELPERDLTFPFNEPFEPAKVLPGVGDKVKITLEKTVPDMKYKIKTQVFTGTGYQFKVAIDLAGALGLGEIEGAKPIETNLSYLAVPEAPVLGIAAISLQGLISVKYELSDGTGVEQLLTGKAKPGKK